MQSPPPTITIAKKKKMSEKLPTLLLHLPNEILLLIAGCLDDFRHLHSFFLTNRRLSVILAKPLYLLASRASTDLEVIAILWAIASQNEQMLRELLSVGSSRITIKDQHGRVLCLVSRRNIPNAGTVARIFSEFATIKIRVKNGRRTSHGGLALEWAAKLGKVALVHLLLDRGADIDACDQQGCTALHYGASMNREEVVRLLLRKGAMRHIVGRSGETPLDVAMVHRNLDISLMLLEGTDVTIKYQQGRTALHIAAEYPIEDVSATIVESFLKKGADVGAAYSRGITPIYYAVLLGNEKVVKLLLDAGAWTHQRPYHNPIIRDAIRNNHYDIARLLLETAPANFLETQRTTPLHRAVEFSPHADIALVKLVLDKGTPIDAADCSGKTALHLAAKYGYLDVVELLLERGADIHILDNYLSDALIHAAAKPTRSSNGEYIGLRDRGATSNMLQIARLLLKSGANINTQDNRGKTAMHYAVSTGGLAMVELLLEFGSDLSLVDSGKQTPLETAWANVNVGCDEANILRLLINANTSQCPTTL